MVALSVERWLSGMSLKRLRIAVLVTALLAFALKLFVAATTIGTDDTYLFKVFSGQVDRFGPVGIYGAAPEVVAPYNHPPLSGWMLYFFNFLVDQGFRYYTLIRLPAIVADLVTTMLIFELIRQRRPLWEAAVGAALFAWSPVLGIISGFHGNTDPVFVMFTVLSLYLLLMRQSPALAGISYALGLSIKLVPIVALPLLLLVAWRLGRTRFLAFAAGAGAVMLLLWTWPMVQHFDTLRRNVIGYAGYGPKQFGPSKFADWLNLPGLVELYAGPGRFLVLAVCAGVPAYLAWKRADLTIPALGLTFALFLLLTPVHATQYFAWPVAGLYLIHVYGATMYSLAAGLLLTKTYSRWNHGYPWNWNQAWSNGMSREEEWAGALIWLLLLTVIGYGMWDQIRQHGTVSASAAPAARRGAADAATAQATTIDSNPARVTG